MNLLDRIRKLEMRRVAFATRPPVSSTARAARAAHILDRADRPGCTNQPYLLIAELVRTAQARELATLA